MRRLSLVVTLLAFVIAGSSACASKGFVKNSVSQVSAKVDSLSQSLEETQERTKKNEAKIAEVDQRTAKAQSSADQAHNAAMTADGKAVTADSKAVAASESAKMAASKADDIEKASKRLTYEVVLSDSEGNFKFNAVDLPASAKAKIDELVTKLKADPNGAYFEIEGYTDNVGPKDVNDRIALQRADAVKRYLYEQHQIPLHRMNIIGYGPDKPAASNETKEGRAQNRRVVIKVLV